MAQVGTGTTSHSLARDAIGLREVLFQAVTHMGPALSVAFAIALGATFAGGSLNLAVLIAMGGCLCVALCVGELSRYLPSAGGIYTYVAKGLHPSLGFLVAWGYALVEPMIAPAIFLLLGGLVAGTFNTEFGWSTGLWWPWFFVGAALIYIFNFLGVKLSTKTGTILGAFEIAVFAVLAIWLIVKAGSHNTLTVFGAGYTTIPGYKGAAGLFAASIFTILAFTGFEGAAPLAEESRDRRRTVRWAVIGSVLAVGAFYLLTTYAASVFFGPGRMQKFAAFGGGNPWDAVSREVWGAGWVLVFLAIVNSCLANANAAAIAGSRIWFSMGRVRLLPEVVSRTHPRWKSPYLALSIQFGIGLVAALVLGFKFKPLTAFGLFATVITAVIIVMYVMTNLATIVYFRREHRAEFNFLKHLVIPVLGIAFFVPGWLTAVGIPAFKFVGRLSYPLTLVGPVIAVWYVVGIVYMVYLYRRAPERIAGTAQVFAEEPRPESQPSPANV
jgi:amino acid transporter